VVAALTEVARGGGLAGGRLDVIAGVKEFRAGGAATIRGLVATDASTLTIEMSSANYELPALLADPSYGIGRPTGDGEAGAAQVVGSGPFVPVASDGTTLRLAPAESDIDGVSAIEFVAFGSDDAAMKAYEAGSVDVAPAANGVALVEAGGDARFRVSAGTLMLSVSNLAPPLADVGVRRALLAGVDREAAVAAMGDAWAVANGVVPGDLVCDASCGVDDAVARNGLMGLAATGAPLHLDVPAGDVAARLAAELERQIEVVGVPVEVRPVDGAALEQAVGGGGSELLLFAQVGLAPSVDPYLAQGFAGGGGENVSGMSSPEFDSALAVARATSDADARADAYRQAEAIVVSNGAALPLAELGRTYAVRRSVRGVQPVSGVLFDGRSVHVAANR
jgi:ABC-type transport system substrate-binding protein